MTKKTLKKVKDKDKLYFTLFMFFATVCLAIFISLFVMEDVMSRVAVENEIFELTKETPVESEYIGNQADGLLARFIETQEGNSYRVYYRPWQLKDMFKEDSHLIYAASIKKDGTYETFFEK